MPSSGQDIASAAGHFGLFLSLPSLMSVSAVFLTTDLDLSETPTALGFSVPSFPYLPHFVAPLSTTRALSSFLENLLYTSGGCNSSRQRSPGLGTIRADSGRRVSGARSPSDRCHFTSVRARRRRWRSVRAPILPPRAAAPGAYHGGFSKFPVVIWTMNKP